MAGKQRDVNCTQGDFFICIVASSGSNTREKLTLNQGPTGRSRHRNLE